MILGNHSLRHMRSILDFNTNSLEFAINGRKVPVGYMPIDDKAISLLLEQPYNLNDAQENAIKQLITDYKDVLTDDIGHTDRYTLNIRLKDKKPV